MIELIFGETDFKYIWKIKNKKIYNNWLTNKIFLKDKNSHKVSIGQFGKYHFKEKNCKKVLFAGKVKPEFSKLIRFWVITSKIIKKSKIGDAAILKEIINILKERYKNDKLDFY